MLLVCSHAAGGARSAARTIVGERAGRMRGAAEGLAPGNGSKNLVCPVEVAGGPAASGRVSGGAVPAACSRGAEGMPASRSGLRRAVPRPRGSSRSARRAAGPDAWARGEFPAQRKAPNRSRIAARIGCCCLTPRLYRLSGSAEAWGRLSRRPASSARRITRGRAGWKACSTEKARLARPERAGQARELLVVTCTDEPATPKRYRQIRRFRSAPWFRRGRCEALHTRHRPVFHDPPGAGIMGL